MANLELGWWRCEQCGVRVLLRDRSPSEVAHNCQVLRTHPARRPAIPERPPVPTACARAALGGPGTELKKTLAGFGIHARGCLECEGLAAEMDAWGPDGCAARIDEIASRLAQRADQRLLVARFAPGLSVRLAAKIAVKFAIRRARQAQAAQRPARLAAVAAYFNPCGYRRRRENYERFAEGLAGAGVELFTAEAGIEFRYELPEGPRVWRFPARGSLWQKERLLNLAIERLPSEFDAVAWLDADLLFSDPGWPARALDLLAVHPAVQLFHEIVFLGPDGREHPWRNGHSRAPGAVARRSGMPGGAWAARRETLSALGGLWDGSICGGGDRVFLHAALGRLDRTPDYARAWAALAAAAIAPRAGFLPGRVDHLWHGDRERRQYAEREAALARLGFDPRRHLRLVDGLWDWSDQASPELRRFVRDYFAARQEDG